MQWWHRAFGPQPPAPSFQPPAPSSQLPAPSSQLIASSSQPPALSSHCTAPSSQLPAVRFQLAAFSSHLAAPSSQPPDCVALLHARVHGGGVFRARPDFNVYNNKKLIQPIGPSADDLQEATLTYILTYIHTYIDLRRMSPIYTDPRIQVPRRTVLLKRNVKRIYSMLSRAGLGLDNLWTPSCLARTIPNS